MVGIPRGLYCGRVQSGNTILSLFRPGELPEAAPQGRVAREWYLDHYPEHPGYAATPRRVLSIFREAETGWWLQQCDLFDDLIENDGTLRNLFEQREGAVAGKPWDLQPDGAEGDSELAAEVLSLALEPLPMSDTFAHQLGSNRYGAAESEIDWTTLVHNGRIFVVPGWFADVPARRFRIDCKSQRLRLLTERAPVEGEPLAPGKWWETRAPGAQVARAGLMRTAAPLALYKRYGTRDLVTYAEKFGMPGLLAEVPEEASPAAKGVLRKVVKNFGTDAGGLFERPTGMPADAVKFHILQAAAADSSGTHGTLITFCNREMAKLINGATLSNDNADSGGASYALGEVHAATRWETVQRDAERLKETFHRCVALPFMRFNGLAGRAPKLEIQVVRDLEPKDLLEAAERMVKLGKSVSESQVRGFTGLHKPIGPGDEIGPGAMRGSEAPNDAVAAMKAVAAGGDVAKVATVFRIDERRLRDDCAALGLLKEAA